MPSITINSCGETDIEYDNPDKNCSKDSLVGMGYITNTDASLSWTSGLYWFEIPEILKSNNIRITSVNFKARKYSAYYMTIDSSGAFGAITQYGGILLNYFGFENDNNCYNTITWNNCERLTGKKPDSYGNNPISTGSCLNGDYYEVNLSNFLNIIPDKHFHSKFITLKVTGYRTQLYGTYYKAQNYINTGSITINYVNLKPVAKITSYPTSVSTTHTATINWNYSSEISSSQSSCSIEYSTNAGASWNLLETVSGDSTSYIIPADRFSEGNVYFRIRATDSERHVSDYSNVIIINYHVPAPVISIADWSITKLNRVATLPITWTFQSEDGYTQAQFTIQWSSDNGSNWNTIIRDTTDQFYTFGIKAFPVGNIILRLKVKDSHGLESAWQVKSFSVYNQSPSVECGYPSGVTINNSNIIIFTWSFTEEIQRGQKSYELMYSEDNESTWTTIKETSGNQFKEFPANTFTTGTIIWKIRVTDIDDNISSWNKTSFIAIGKTAAPTITEVTNSSIPTVKWTTSSQDCFEINIRNSNNELIYQSQLQLGADVREFKCPLMLENGFYSVEVRVLNEFGLYTEWSSLSFQIDLPSPQAPISTFIYLDNDYSVSIDGEGAPGVTTYVVRRDDDTGNIKILDIFIGNTVKDYTAALGKTYSYTLRSYGKEDTAGYSDGEWSSINIPLENHVILHKCDDKSIFVDLYKSDDNIWNIAREDSYSKKYRFTIGREFPVIERTEWNNSKRSFKAWVSDDELDLLNQMHNIDVYYRGEKEAFLCDMTISIGDRYVSGGRLVSITLVRIEENEVNVL